MQSTNGNILDFWAKDRRLNVDAQVWVEHNDSFGGPYSSLHSCLHLRKGIDKTGHEHFLEPRFLAAALFC